ncbi:hypothetical protein ACLBWT_18595 [Paenibacillus sp. D51F]
MKFYDYLAACMIAVIAGLNPAFVVLDRDDNAAQPFIIAGYGIYPYAFDHRVACGIRGQAPASGRTHLRC